MKPRMKFPFRDFFLDTETLGTRPGSAVIQLGAVAFNLDTGELGPEFFREIKPAAPFTASIETLQWREEKGLGPIPTHGIHPRDAVFHFQDWLRDNFDCPEKERRFWSWGSSMDFPVLEPVLDLRNPEDKHPWEYWQINDARGFWQMAFGDLRHSERPHDALEDAKLGAIDLVAAIREIRFGKIQPLIDGLEQIRDMVGGESEDPERDITRIQDIADAALSKVIGKEAA